MATACADAPDTLLYSVAQIRAIENAARAALPTGTLMQAAGRATADATLKLLGTISPQTRVLVIAGPGNNGGDALEAAALLSKQGIDVAIVLLADSAQYSAEAQQALTHAQAGKSRFIALSAASGAWSLAIDGLFGIGLTRAPEGEFSQAIAHLNALSCPVLSIDVPSGLDADTGDIIGSKIGSKASAVCASDTLTFIANKPGLHTGHGRDCAGRVVVHRLHIPPGLYGSAVAELSHPALFTSAMKQRKHASHKGSYGDLTVIGGATGMQGAVILAARMGAMAGAGRVFAAFLDSVPGFDPIHPELMCRSAADIKINQGALVIGPGLGMSRAATDVLARALSCDLPLLIDADALNLIAVEPILQMKLAHRSEKMRNKKTVTLLTPHPREAARLMGVDVEHIQSHRLAAATELARRFHAYVVLKGSGSVIASPEGNCVINSTGNAALATAGTGDVLAGLCGALLAQQWPAWEAALGATWIHGKAADRMWDQGIGPIGVTAAELLPFIRAELNH